MFGTVRYEKVPSDILEGAERGEQEDEEEGEALVYLRPLSANQRRGCRGRRETCLRIAVALVLLAIALGFVLYEWSSWDAEQGSRESQTAHADKSSKGHEHHHHTGDEDDHDDDDNDDGDGDDHKGHGDHHEHSHGDSGAHKHTHPGSLFHHAAVITSSAICSRAGRKLLQDGGNVVDAGIAALLCLGVVHPHTAGIGGTFSAIFYNHTSGSRKAIQPSFPQNNINSYGIPAILPGIKRLHAQYGNLEWAKLFEDAIRLAKDGFQIDHILASALLTNKRRIAQSKLCILFCDENGHVKSEGSNVTNQNLSELLHNVSLNDSHFPEMLAMKLARDLSPEESPDFIRDVRRVRGEINDPLITEEEKYSLLSVSPPFSGSILSDALEKATEQIHSLHNHKDLNSSGSVLSGLLNFTKEIYNSTQAKENGSLVERRAMYVASSQIGVLHSEGHFLVMSVSLNSSWGSGRYLPSSGVILSDFVSNVGVGAPLLNFPLVVKIKNDDDGDDDDEDDDDDDHHEHSDEDVQIIAVTGGLSALLNAAQILTNRLDHGMSAQEAVQGPLFHLAQGGTGPVAMCVSTVSDGTDVFTVPQEEGAQLQPADRCTDDSTAMLLQLHAGHVGAYGAPALKTHTDGF